MLTLLKDNLILPATDGRQTLAQSANVFPGWLDGDFANWGTDVASSPTEATPVEVHELTRDGRFDEIYPSFGVELDRLCLTQSQIIEFVRSHRPWLHPKGWATFFLFKVGNDFFVARVDAADHGRLRALVYRFSRGHVWHAGSRHRFVFPQLTLGNSGTPKTLGHSDTVTPNPVPPTELERIAVALEKIAEGVGEIIKKGKKK